jgi:predicted amidohydrolase
MGPRQVDESAQRAGNGHIAPRGEVIARYAKSHIFNTDQGSKLASFAFNLL